MEALNARALDIRLSTTTGFEEQDAFIVVVSCISDPVTTSRSVCPSFTDSLPLLSIESDSLFQPDYVRQSFYKYRSMTFTAHQNLVVIAF